MAMPNSGYRPTDTPGLYEIEVGGGWMPVPSTPEELEGEGYQLQPAAQYSPEANGGQTYNPFTGSTYTQEPPPAAPPPPAGMGGAGGTGGMSGNEMGAGNVAPEPPRSAPPPAVAAPQPVAQPAAPPAPPPRTRVGGAKPKAKPPVNPDDPTGAGAQWASAQGENFDPLAAADEAAADASIERKVIAQQRADIVGGAAQRRSEMLDEQAEMEAAGIERQRERNARIAADYEERQAAIDREREKVRQLKVNPRQYFEDQDAFATILSGIALVAGGLRAGVQGGKNQAMELMDRAIDRNIDAQKANIELRRQGLTDRVTELERLQNLYGTPEAAEQELRDRHRMLIQTYADKEAADAQNQEAALNLRETFAQWDTERAQNQAQLAAALQQDALDKALRAEVSRRTPYAALLPQENVRGLGMKLAEEDLKPRGTGGGALIGGKEVHQLANEWNANKLTDLDAAIGNYEDLLSMLPEGEIPTQATRNIASRTARRVLDTVGGEGTGARAFDSPEEIRATERLERQLNAAKSAELGAARSDAELSDFQKGQQTINTREGVAARIQELKRERQRRAATVRAGHRPETVVAFESQKKNWNVTPRAPSMRAE